MRLLLILFSMNVYAEVSQEHVSDMLNQMVRENVISKEEAQKAEIKMKTMRPEEWKQINQKAAEISARSPASVEPAQNKIEEVNKVDLSGAQFLQIQEDIKKIIPDYKE